MVNATQKSLTQATLNKLLNQLKCHRIPIKFLRSLSWWVANLYSIYYFIESFLCRMFIVLFSLMKMYLRVFVNWKWKKNCSFSIVHKVENRVRVYSFLTLTFAFQKLAKRIFRNMITYTLLVFCTEHFYFSSVFGSGNVCIMNNQK